MIAWQDGDVLTNGIRLHYHRSGGDKPPIVLLHGITDSGMCWPLVAGALADSYDLIGVDARGHGLSEKPESEKAYTREEHAKDVAGLIETLGLEKPAIMGHSMGSGTATTLAAMYPALPGALVLEDPPWREVDESPEGKAATMEHLMEWKDLIIARKKMTREDLLAKGKADNPLWPDAVYDNWLDAKYAVSEKVVGYVNGLSMGWEEAVSRIQCPTLVVTAEPELGAIVTPEIAKRVQNNPHVSVAKIADAGHNIRREQFDAYIAAVKSFLTKKYPAK